MRHSFYAPNRNKDPGARRMGSDLRKNYICDSQGKHTSMSKDDRILSMRIKSALDRYSGDSEKRSEILGEVSMFEVNRTIARECHDKQGEKALAKNFNRYLSEI